MNILFLAYFPFLASKGGIQRVTDVLTKEFIKKGHSVFFLCVNNSFISSASIDQTSAPQYFINANSDNMIELAEQLLLKHNIDFIINQTPNSFINLFLKKLILKVKVKVISVFHTQPFFNDNLTRKQIWQTHTFNVKQLCFKYISYVVPAIQKNVFGYFEKKNILGALEVSDKVCFISDKFYNRVLKHLPDIPMNKMAAINNPNTFEIDHDVNNKENIILWVGRVENGSKNTIDFVKAWHLICKANSSWKAIIVGEGDDLEYIKQYIKKKHIQNIESLGHCKDVKPLYKRSKFVVVTSYSESWCMVLTEGLINGCIPLAYNTFETVGDIIQNNYNGYITDANPIAMSQKLNEIMNDETTYEEVYSNTFESVRKFNVDNIVDSWIRLLSSL